MKTKSRIVGRLALRDDAETENENQLCTDHMEEELRRMGVALEEGGDIEHAVQALQPLWSLLEEKGYFFQEVNCKEDGHSREEDGIMLWFLLKGEGYSVSIGRRREGRVEIEQQGDFPGIGHKLSFPKAESGTEFTISLMEVFIR